MCDCSDSVQRQGGLHRRVRGGGQGAGRGAVRRSAADLQRQARRAGPALQRRRRSYTVTIHHFFTTTTKVKFSNTY